MSRYLVVYAVSGLVQPMDGVFDLLEISKDHIYPCPAILHEPTDSGPIFLLDPRCMVYEYPSMRVVYNPRAHVAEMPRDMRNWMTRNPAWGSKASKQTGRSSDEA